MWASNPSVITKLLGPAIDADVPVYGLPVTMARTGKDYSTMPTDVLVEMLNFSDIDPAAAKKFNENMAKQGYIGFDAVDDFPGVDAPVPVLREYFETADGNTRKKFVQAMDKAKLLEAGLPDVAPCPAATR